MLYWKLYSQPAAVANVCKRLVGGQASRTIMSGELARISKTLPPRLSKNPDEIIRLLRAVTGLLTGMASSCAIPVRTTLLHFLYPEIVPIFDKQALKAVGIHNKDANHSYDILRQYLPHAWLLAERYDMHFATFPKETPVRLIDIALWVNRGT